MKLLRAKISTVLVLVCCFLAFAEAQELETFRIQYDNFTDRNYYSSKLEEIGEASVDNDALQVTPDSFNSGYLLKNRSGRVLLKEPFRLWDGDATANNSTRVASFNTSFLINIYRNESETAGEGLAFVIAPGLDMPNNSYGEYLGLTNATTDGNSSNKLIAIEIDTFKQDYDPDANHVGLDINSVRSVKSESLTPHNITVVPIGLKFINIWIQYDGVNKTLQVYIAEQAEMEGPTPPRPDSPILMHNLSLRDHVNEYSYFGFSASTGKTSQLNCVRRWNLTVQYLAEDKKPWLKIGVVTPHKKPGLRKLMIGVVTRPHKKPGWVVTGLAAGVPSLVLFLMAAAWLWYYLHQKRKARSNLDIVGKLKSLPGTPREFRFKDLKKATNNFDGKNKLGEGGFGVVYRGKLAGEECSEIAVKLFRRESIKGPDDFLAELTIINRLRHKHLVRLLGWCHKKKSLLVYEYMPNGCLDKHLFTEPDKEPLNWNLRTKIISGVASALHYLHNEYDQKVVHRDLKASNIMLDADFNARLGDFGLARALDNEKTSYAEAEGVLGTMGYIAPECFHMGKATQRSDVYAFGAVILEVVCGLPPGTRIDNFQFLVDWVWFMYRQGRLLEAVDERLGDDYDAEEAERLLLLGLACSHPIASERPKTQDIMQITSGTIPPPNVPPFKPAFIWPAMLPIDMDSSAINTTSVTETNIIETSITTSHFNSGWSDQYLSMESYTERRGHSMV